MILSDGDIRAAMARPVNPLIIDPPVLDQAIQPASLELTLGKMLYDLHGFAYPATVDDMSLWMYPGQFLLGTTREKVHIPADLVAQVNGKSTWARKGLIVHTTAGFIDPGFRGQITLEFKNLGDMPIKLVWKMPICQLVFFAMTSPAQRPYGHKDLGSHYQDQVGTTPSAG